MMFFHRVALESVVVVALASSLELLFDDAGEHIYPGKAWTKAEGDCALAGYGGGFHHNNGLHTGGTFATWNFSIPKSGCYWVEEWHPVTSACDFTLSSRVPIHIHFCKGLQTAGLVDQSTRGGQWNRLVKLPYYTTHLAQIHISALEENFEPLGVWAADAFRLTWHANDCHDKTSEADDLPEEEAKRSAEAQLPLLQARVDDVDALAQGLTLEPVEQCPATVTKSFHHDGLNKGQRAQATYRFDPPIDGCYLIEEKHPQLDQCKASSSTKVHINYCRGMSATGTVDQTANGGQWTFVGALPFYAGWPGDVTLSNEGTEDGTLTTFDEVRFTWSGRSCRYSDSHPRQCEIRMAVDFQFVADRLPEFGSALKAKLAMLAEVPEKSLRLTDLRSGSIIAEFLVMPSFVDNSMTSSLTAEESIERLRGAVAKNAADLCALTGAPPEGCNVEITDLGRARPTIRPVRNQKQRTEDEEGEDLAYQIAGIIVICVACTAVLGFCVSVVAWHIYQSRKAKNNVPASTEDKAAESEEGRIATVEEKPVLPLEPAKAAEPVEEQKPVEDDNTSTLCPSNSDKQSEASRDAENSSTPESGLAIFKALSHGDL